MTRGEIWWASLREPKGSEPGYRRPVVIVQSDDFTASQIRTVIVAAVSTNQRLAMAPGNVHLPKKRGGLERESVVNVSQLLTIDKASLRERTGRLSRQQLHQLEEGLRLVLAL